MTKNQLLPAFTQKRQNKQEKESYHKQIDTLKTDSISFPVNTKSHFLNKPQNILRIQRLQGNQFVTQILQRHPPMINEGSDEDSKKDIKPSKNTEPKLPNQWC